MPVSTENDYAARMQVAKRMIDQGWLALEQDGSVRVGYGTSYPSFADDLGQKDKSTFAQHIDEWVKEIEAIHARTPENFLGLFQTNRVDFEDWIGGKAKIQELRTYAAEHRIGTPSR